MSSFHDACSAGDLLAIERALLARPALAFRAFEGYLPLQRAIPHRPEVLALLLESGEDPDRALRRVHWFPWEDRVEVDAAQPWRPLHMAAVHGYHRRSPRVVEVLVEAGAELRAPSPLEGYGALHLAALCGHHAVLRALVEAGLELDPRATRGPACLQADEVGAPAPPFSGVEVTPLMVACQAGQVACVEALLALGAGLELRDGGGHTALHHAAGGALPGASRVAIVQLLLARGAESGAVSGAGASAAELARGQGHDAVVAALEAAEGADGEAPAQGLMS